MRKNLFVSMFVLLAAVLVLSACGPAATPTPQTVVEVQTQVAGLLREARQAIGRVDRIGVAGGC